MSVEAAKQALEGELLKFLSTCGEGEGVASTIEFAEKSSVQHANKAGLLNDVSVYLYIYIKKNTC